MQEKPQLVADYGWVSQPLILKRLRSSWVVPRVTISWIISWDHSQSGNIAVSIEGDPGGLTVGLERLGGEQKLRVIRHIVYEASLLLEVLLYGRHLLVV